MANRCLSSSVGVQAIAPPPRREVQRVIVLDRRPRVPTDSSESAMLAQFSRKSKRSSGASQAGMRWHELGLKSRNLSTLQLFQACRVLSIWQTAGGEGLLLPDVIRGSR
jgi:hypothetical protein